MRVIFHLATCKQPAQMGRFSRLDSGGPEGIRTPDLLNAIEYRGRFAPYRRLPPRTTDAQREGRCCRRLPPFFSPCPCTNLAQDDTPILPLACSSHRIGILRRSRPPISSICCRYPIHSNGPSTQTTSNASSLNIPARNDDLMDSVYFQRAMHQARRGSHCQRSTRAARIATKHPDTPAPGDHYPLC